MPLSSENTEAIDRTVTELPLSSIPRYWSEPERQCPPFVLSDNSAWTFSLETRLRIIQLETAVPLPETEYPDLQREIAFRELNIQSQEAKINNLEETIERKDQRMRECVENYEAIISGKDREFKERIENDQTTSSNRSLGWPSFLSHRTKVRAWFDRIFPR